MSTVYYAVLPRTPLGRIFVAAGARGVVAVSFGVTERAFVATLGKENNEIIRAPQRVSAILHQLDEYLRGKRAVFDVPLDLTQRSVFQRRVLRAALKIPYGQTMTYGELARRTGGAARATGQALAHNPIPIIIPCHRVLAADRSLRGYSGGGGLKTKAWLLKMEKARLGADARR